MQSQNKLSLRQIIVLGLLISVALVLSYFERFIPMNFAMPGIKLGLANVVTLLALTLYKPKEIYFLVVVRVVLASIFVGSVMSLWYSLAGGLLSATAMLLMCLLPKDNISLVGISVIGAICHNVGQIIIVMIITGNAYVAVTYLPILLVAGVITGIFIGYVARATKPYLIRLM